MEKPEPFQLPLPLTLDDALVVIAQLGALIDQLNAGNLALMEALAKAQQAGPFTDA